MSIFFPALKYYSVYIFSRAEILQCLYFSRGSAAKYRKKDGSIVAHDAPPAVPAPSPGRSPLTNKKEKDRQIAVYGRVLFGGEEIALKAKAKAMSRKRTPASTSVNIDFLEAGDVESPSNSDREQNKRLRNMSSAIAKQFVCSISQELMVHPMIAEDGNTYVHG